MADERKSLIRLDTELRAGADRMLVETGLGKLIYERGYHHVGSYAMRTMVWRDLDFERAEDPPDWRRHWEFGARLAELGLIWKFSCVDSYRDRRVATPENGLYWGIQFDYPAGGAVWKIDLWTARQSEWDINAPRRALWMDGLNEENRLHILEIKNAVWKRPEYRITMLSVHIYEAVIERGIFGVEAFLEWWKAKYGPIH
jgi:hypothetical protein